MKLLTGGRNQTPGEVYANASKRPSLSASPDVIGCLFVVRLPRQCWMSR
jgi:hypothetical protein